MRRVAPGSVTTIGTLNIIFGSLFSFCCLSAVVFQLAGLGGLEGPARQNFEQLINNELPGYVIINWVCQALGVFCFLLMAISGVGLVSHSNWARLLAILTAWILMPFLLAWGLYSMAWEMPTITRLMRANPMPGARDMVGFYWFTLMIRVGVALLIFAYALITVILLMGARVRTFFTQADFEDGFYGEEEWDDREPRHRDRDRGRGRGWRDWDS